MNEYGVRWREWSRGGQLVTKERFFKTDTARSKFATKTSEKDAFHEFLAWSDPKVVHH